MPKSVEMWPPGATGAEAESVKFLVGSVEAKKADGWTLKKPKKVRVGGDAGPTKGADEPPKHASQT